MNDFSSLFCCWELREAISITLWATWCSWNYKSRRKMFSLLSVFMSDGMTATRKICWNNIFTTSRLHPLLEHIYFYKKSSRSLIIWVILRCKSIYWSGDASQIILPNMALEFTRGNFSSYSYYTFTTIDENSFFSRSIESIHACWKQCFAAPTGIMYMKHEPFFIRLQLPSHPKRQASVGKIHSISRKIYFLSLAISPCFLFSWVWKFVRNSVDFCCQFRFHVVSFQFLY